MPTINPLRGEIWQVNLNPTVGREQAGVRPALVVSANPLNRSAADLVIVVPITSKAKGIPYHVPIRPPEGGVKSISYIKPEDIRSISKQRLVRPWGNVSSATMTAVADMLRVTLDL